VLKLAAKINRNPLDTQDRPGAADGTDRLKPVPSGITQSIPLGLYHPRVQVRTHLTKDFSFPRFGGMV
jgi:hypothetical protein